MIYDDIIFDIVIVILVLASYHIISNLPHRPKSDICGSQIWCQIQWPNLVATPLASQRLLERSQNICNLRIQDVQAVKKTTCPAVKVWFVKLWCCKMQMLMYFWNVSSLVSLTAETKSNLFWLNKQLPAHDYLPYPLFFGAWFMIFSPGSWVSDG